MCEGSVLKPSVFVGKSNLSGIGCQWDRTKYNVVLLPDLSKVVYPDLDDWPHKPDKGKFAAYDSNNLIYDGGTSNRVVDRSCKPKPSPKINIKNNINEVMKILAGVNDCII